ncbi:GNAT family N-acetyltransferase [Clostridiaceae bacterium UIB06]|uniref:GNAT family N-acetyltransferase n=1 Tax=Clostridium thailandense TaxID=2794346 RepID=A0A949TSC6_9CLOT|nr:GNAT family N-acetyltransferase [Clostridium thailandense]MBV7272456.1 GNAT family N-acetyltransferase [Clostridium thailandense]MCH5136980.1 GNAT family N-acetyltransferase [Clostridiaceae bacterium UIB06]
MEIKEISFLTYMLKCRTFSTLLSDYHVRNAVSINGTSLLAAYTDGEDSDILGFCVLNKSEAKYIKLDYLLVREEERGKGIGKELLVAAINYAKKQGDLGILARIVINDKEKEDLVEAGSRESIIAEKLLVNCGFKIKTTSKILRCTRDEKTKNIWHEFMEKKGEKLIARSERHGFSAVSFAKAGRLIDNLKERIEEEFPKELNLKHYIDNPVDRLVPELSFIAVKNDIPIAYCIVTTSDGKTVVFQQLSVALKYKRTGVFLLPFQEFMEQFFLQNIYKKISYMVLDVNKEMISLVNGFLNPFIESKKTQNFYMLEIK